MCSKIFLLRPTQAYSKNAISQEHLQAIALRFHFFKSRQVGNLLIFGLFNAFQKQYKDVVSMKAE